jgi:hypothetical protein
VRTYVRFADHFEAQFGMLATIVHITTNSTTVLLYPHTPLFYAASEL